MPYSFILLRLKEVIFRNEETEIAIDFEEKHKEGIASYTIILKQISFGRYSGRYDRRRNGQAYQETANARLFRDGDGYLLFGSFTEEGEQLKWWAEIYGED